MNVGFHGWSPGLDYFANLLYQYLAVESWPTWYVQFLLPKYPRIFICPSISKVIPIQRPLPKLLPDIPTQWQRILFPFLAAFTIIIILAAKKSHN